MKVLVFGATGFIGNPTALAFTRAGHQVIVTPLVVDPKDVEKWRHVIKEVDAVVECLGGDDLRDQGLRILEVVVEEAKKHRPNGPPLSYCYCSGTWVHGDDRIALKTDRTPITDPLKLTAWRVEIEQKALKSQSDSFTANVVRPSIVYGTSGSLTGMWFASPSKGKVEIVGDAEQRIATIHQDDLAEAFVLVAEKAYSIKGVIFDISNPYPESMGYIAKRLQDVSGAQSISFKAAESDFEKALAASDVLRPTLAKSLLGWYARKPPIAEGMEVYYAAWQASAA